MDKRTTAEPPVGSPANPIPLPNDRKTLKAYYRGERLRSPLGGRLEFLGAREGEEGEGRVMLECGSSSIRYVLVVPKATRTERAKVKEMLEAGADPTCPRHGPRQPLLRSGRKWSCPRCGVTFGKAV